MSFDYLTADAASASDLRCALLDQRVELFAFDQHFATGWTVILEPTFGDESPQGLLAEVTVVRGVL